MRKIFIVLLFIWMILLIGCGGDATETNQTNTQNAAANTEPEIGVTPLPEFTDADTALAEGNKLFDANKIDMAIEAYDQAVRLNPDLAEAYFKLGVAYSLIEKQQEAEAYHEEVEPTPTPSPDKKSKKEVVRKKNSEKAFEKAVAAYKKIIKQNSEDAVAHFNLGRALNKLNEDEDAAKALRQAVKLQPENAEFQTELGAILIKLAEYDEAVRVLKKALELDPQNSETEELLEKAQAGKKRIEFGVTPKPRPKQTEKPKQTEEPDEEPTPEPKPGADPRPPVNKPSS